MQSTNWTRYALTALLLNGQIKGAAAAAAATADWEASQFEQLFSGIPAASRFDQLQSEVREAISLRRAPIPARPMEEARRHQLMLLAQEHKVSTSKFVKIISKPNSLI